MGRGLEQTQNTYAWGRMGWETHEMEAGSVEASATHELTLQCTHELTLQCTMTNYISDTAPPPGPQFWKVQKLSKTLHYIWPFLPKPNVIKLKSFHMSRFNLSVNPTKKHVDQFWFLKTHFIPNLLWQESIFQSQILWISAPVYCEGILWNMWQFEQKNSGRRWGQPSFLY